MVIVRVNDKVSIVFILTTRLALLEWLFDLLRQAIAPVSDRAKKALTVIGLLKLLL